jgi:hypothetical protein
MEEESVIRSMVSVTRLEYLEFLVVLLPGVTVIFLKMIFDKCCQTTVLEVNYSRMSTGVAYKDL